MADSWSQVFEDTVGGRPVKGEIYDEGGYKVTTTQKEDYPGSLSGDESNTIIIPPREAGTPIEIEAETLEELEKDLVTEGFSKDEAKTIVDKFPT